MNHQACDGLRDGIHEQRMAATGYWTPALGEVDTSYLEAQSLNVNVEQLKELVQAQPFEAFCLVTANGERLAVTHEDFIWIMPNRRVVQVALPTCASRWVNLQLVAGLEKPLVNGKHAAKRRKRREQVHRRFNLTWLNPNSGTSATTRKSAPAFCEFRKRAPSSFKLAAFHRRSPVKGTFAVPL